MVRETRKINTTRVIAVIALLIDIVTFGAIFVVLGHDVGGTLECTSTNGLCPNDAKTTVQCAGAGLVNNVTESSTGLITVNCVGSGGDSASTFQCAGGKYAYNVTETSAGSISFLCSQVTWSQLGGFPSGCSAGTFVSSVGSSLTCVKTGNFVSNANSATFSMDSSQNGKSTGYGVTITLNQTQRIIVATNLVLQTNVTVEPSAYYQLDVYTVNSASIPAKGTAPTGTNCFITGALIASAGKLTSLPSSVYFTATGNANNCGSSGSFSSGQTWSFYWVMVTAQAGSLLTFAGVLFNVEYSTMSVQEF